MDGLWIDKDWVNIGKDKALSKTKMDESNSVVNPR